MFRSVLLRWFLGIAFGAVLAAGADPTMAQVAAPGGNGAADAVPVFRVHPPGKLKDNYGNGIAATTLYAPDMRFPINAAATPNSQIRSPGGFLYKGPSVPGGQCAQQNYNEEWWDTFCETRGGTNRASLNCPSREIHQGIDIRGGTVDTCKQLTGNKHANNVPIVAVYDGTIDEITTFVVKLRTKQGLFWYLHMNMSALPYSKSDLPKAVKKGDLIGYLSNDFGGSDTTFHLHFEHRMSIDGKGTVPVPLYCDLVLAYERDRHLRHEMMDGAPPCGRGPLPQPVAAPEAATPVATATPPAPSSPEAPSPQTPPTSGGSSLAATEGSVWRHDLSTMRLVVEGERVAFVYETPSEGMGQLVARGTVLFEGTKSGDDWSGRAHVFSAGCPAGEYPVTGRVAGAGRRIVLTGERPVRGPDCATKTTKPDSRLLFVLQAPTATGNIAAAPIAPGSDAPPSTTAAAVIAPSASGGVVPSGAAAMLMLPPASAGFQPSVCTRTVCVDREPFMRAFNAFHKTSDGGRKRDLNVWQIDALTALLNVWDTTAELEGTKRLAYTLATVYHETTNTVYPTRECSCKTNAGAIACSKRLYVKGKAGIKYYLRDAATGHSYYGRGQTQLTLKENYSRVGHNLGYGERLITQPDDALTLEVSAHNAVMGLYHGWYREGLGLKHIAFTDDSDWVRARDVLISKRTKADWVADFGRKIHKTLTFITLAEFNQKYGGAAHGPATAPPVASAAPAIPAEPPAAPMPDIVAGFSTGSSEDVSGRPDAPIVVAAAPIPMPARVTMSAPVIPVPAPASISVTSPPVAAPAPIAVPAPPVAVSPAGADLSPLARATADLEARALELNAGMLDLSKRIAMVRALANAEATARLNAMSALGAISKSADKSAGGSEPLALVAVDFQSTWPPDHKESAWCRLREDDDKAGGPPTLEADDPAFLRYFQEVPGGG